MCATALDLLCSVVGVCSWREVGSMCVVTQAKEKARESGFVVNRRDSHTFVIWVSSSGLRSVCSTMCYWCCYRERYKESRDSLRGCESVNASID